MDINCQLESYVFEGSVTTEVVVACINAFAETCTKKTTIILDNASMHTSHLFQSYLPEWEKKQVTFYFLPSYSPELNKIEVLWRKIKYEWLDFSAYESFAALKDHLFDVLAKVGSEYKIFFT